MGWGLTEFKVCFAEGALIADYQTRLFSGSKALGARPIDSATKFSDNYKNMMKKLITSQLNSRTMGLNFTGWDVCPDVSFDKLSLKQPVLGNCSF